uniref:Uncharacterized protein n=1 Tax=Arion vulgaris TaxID=1028688 RepID=A0A0B7AGL6_9EUPU
MGKQLLGQNHRKAPFEHIAQRDKAHRTAVLSNQEKRYADTAATTNQKMFQNQPHSIPDSARHKEVNFELDRQSPMPWIPPGRYSRSRSLSSEPKAQSRSPFYLQEMNPEDVKSIFPDKHSVQVKKTDRDVPNYGVHSLPSDKILRSADVSSSFIDEVEHRLLQRLAGRVAGENKGASRSNAVPYRRESASTDSAVDMYSDMDEPLDTSDLREKVRMDAVSAVDAPTLENMKLRLTEMQREQREIRQRWSTVHFADTKPKSRIFASSYVQSERFREPPAIEVTRMSKTDGSKSSQIPVTEWKDKEEPMIFTKPCVSSKVTYHHTVDNTKEDELQLESHMIHVKPPKKLVTLKQTTVEKISADRDRFGSYLRKRSHHPSGKFDPWKLVEEISDEILSDCLADVAAEVESISEEIANHMYKSEFVVERNQSETVLHTQKFDPKLDQRLTVDIVNKPMSSGFRYSPQKLVQVEPIETKKTSGSVDRQAADTPSILASGDQQQICAEKAEAEKSPTQRSPSTPGSPAHFSPGKLSPVFSAVEPSLENMSLFLQRVDSSSERKEKGGGDVEEEVGEKEKKYEDDYQEDSNEESYSNDDDDDDGGDVNSDGGYVDDDCGYIDNDGRSDDDDNTNFTHLINDNQHDRIFTVYHILCSNRVT